MRPKRAVLATRSIKRRFVDSEIRLKESPKQTSPRTSPVRNVHHFAISKGSVVEASFSQNR